MPFYGRGRSLVSYKNALFRPKMPLVSHLCKIPGFPCPSESQAFPTIRELFQRPDLLSNQTSGSGEHSYFQNISFSEKTPLEK